MFNKLKSGLDAVKSAVDSGSMSSVIETITPHIQSQIESITDMDVQSVQEDEPFKKFVVAPALTSINAASSGVTSLIPEFDARFNTAMLHVRDELVVFAGSGLSLVEDYKERLPSVLESAFKKATA